ncbi:MAG: malate synthase G [Pseudomonadota bacterium]
MSDTVSAAGLSVSQPLYAFIEEAAAGAGMGADEFWGAVARIATAHTATNEALLERREALQSQIDRWYEENGPQDAAAQEAFLRDIGYLVPEGGDFTIETSGVDPEVAAISGPQLVVPIKNARYALNAANARWGSLYDALYGTDVISEDGGAERGGGYNPARGAKVIAYAKAFLDESFPLTEGSHADAVSYSVNGDVLVVRLENGETASLASQEKFRGYHGEASAPTSILLRNNGLHADIQINKDHPVGRDDLAGVSDIVLESAITTIMDCEDSVAAVDGEDKTEVYSNYLGLLKGDLTTEFSKGGKTVHRGLNADRTYTSYDGSELTLKGRVLMLIRNVGHLMRTPAVKLPNGADMFEGMLDACVTGLMAKYDVGNRHNSVHGSTYIVKPKMHGPEEVAFAVKLFEDVEHELGLPPKTLKIGIMDEERRTTVNLKECIRQAKDRVIFINTGFLDRTGDEIHTSMKAGPFMRKAEIKGAPFMSAYEAWNVDNGLASGFQGRAQIGKGMWAMPDLMAAMVEQKIGHLKAGADCAWVPSPTGATLHALHYHKVDVDQVQEEILNRPRAPLSDILTVPLGNPNDWSAEDIQEELENNCQGILGYVVRWVDHGVGCSKVPDYYDVGLMEDRATCRISSQHAANWLAHGIVTEAQVQETMTRMAAKVDEQNAGDPSYVPMAQNFDSSLAFRAACELVLEGVDQPSGYTEPILHRTRLELKAKG